MVLKILLPGEIPNGTEKCAKNPREAIQKWLRRTKPSPASWNTTMSESGTEMKRGTKRIKFWKLRELSESDQRLHGWVFCMVNNAGVLDTLSDIWKVADAVVERKNDILPGKENLADIIAVETEKVLKK